MIFRTKKAWWKEWALLIAAALSYGYGPLVLLGYTKIDKVLFGSPDFTQWFIGISCLLMGVVCTYFWVGARRGFPRIEIDPGEVRFVDLLGKKSRVDLAEYGRAYVYEHKLSVTIPYLVFYRAEKEAALRQSGVFEPPTEYTADKKIQLSYLVGKGLPSAVEIAKAVNSARIAVETTAVANTEVQRLIREHRRSSRIGRVVLVLLVIAAGLLEFLMERNLSWPMVIAGLLVAVSGLFLEHLEDSPNRWVQRIRRALMFANIVLIIGLLAVILWFVLNWLTGP